MPRQYLVMPTGLLHVVSLFRTRTVVIGVDIENVLLAAGNPTVSEQVGFTSGKNPFLLQAI